MRRLGSLVLRVADETAVPAGRALAVDRSEFSRRITAELEAHPNVEVRREEVVQLPTDELGRARERPAHGACTRGRARGDRRRRVALLLRRDLADRLRRFARPIGRLPRLALGRGRRRLSESAARSSPVIEAFVAALLAADTVPLHAFEKALYFEGCLPIEEMARRGPGTLRFGPMKAAGLTDPRTGRWPARGGAAPPRGQARHDLQPGRLPDEAEAGGAAAHLPLAAGHARGRLRALRLGASQHLRERAARAERGSLAARAAERVARRADGGRRGLRRIGRARLSRHRSRSRGCAGRWRRARAGTAHGALLAHLREAEAATASSR